MEAKGKITVKRIAMYTGLVLLAILWLIPVFTVIATSIKSKQDFFSGMGLFEIPKSPSFKNFSDAISGGLGKYMLNGLVVSALKVPLGILIEAMAAFAITRLRIRHRTAIFVFFLVGMMLPMQIALVPLNIMFSRTGLTNSYFGLFIVYLGFGISFGILILRGFMKSIPKEIDEAACIDGCSRFRLFWNVILPITKPAIASLFILDFLATWNEYLLASVLMIDNDKKTVAAGLMTFVGEHGTDYGLLMAGVLITVVPVLIVYLFCQKYFVEGVSGAVKS